MTRTELRVFLAWFCGCGLPEDAAAALLRLLQMHPLYDHQDELREWVPDEGLRYLLLYALDVHELNEHGGNIVGSWLTTKGEAVRDALAREAADNFEELFAEHCIHGYDFEDESHDCVADDYAQTTRDPFKTTTRKDPESGD